MSTQSPEWIRAARTLRRLGFGARGPEVDSALKSGDTPSLINDLLSADFANDPGVAATPMPDLDVSERPRMSDESEYRRFVQKVNESRRDLTHWWILRMVAANNPANEKLTLLWHNHFATSMEKVRTARIMANQNQKLRELCLGDFRELAYAMLTDAAMVSWLDGQTNRAGAPNENLAREFLELFALGHGNGYSERDVREGARALTGWTIRENVRAELIEKHHDDSVKTILGVTGRIGLEEFCDIVVAKSESAFYIARRLWKQLASDTPPSDATLIRLVSAYGPERDLRRLTTAILIDPEFQHSFAAVVTSPVDWLVGLMRAVRTPVQEEQQIRNVTQTLRALGQLPFHPPNVGGWPQGQAWLSTSAVNIRLNEASKAVQAGDVSLVAEAAVSDRLDAAGYLIGIGAWSDRSAKALKPLRTDPTKLVAAAVNTPEYLTS